MAPSFTALFLFIMFLALPSKTNRLLALGICFFLASSILRAFSASSKIAALLETGCFCVAFSMTAAGAFKIKSLPSRSAIDISFFAIVISFLLTTLVQNIAQLSTIKAGQLPDGVNPWGMTLIVALAYFYYRKDLILRGNILESSTVKYSTLTCSLAIFAIQILIVLGLLEGNTEKVALQQGGYGLGGYSTNDTAFLANALLITQYYYFFSENKRKALFLISSVACLACITLSASRTGAICIAAISATYLYSHKGRNLAFQKAFFSLIFIAIGLIAAQIVIERTSSDAISSGGYSNSLGGAITGSGRALIWEEYISAYMLLAENSWPIRIFGVGPANMAELYQSTSLNRFRLETASGGYLPVHSDLIWLWLACGMLGIVTFIIFLLWSIRRRSMKPTFAPGRAAMWLLLIASLADMFQYSIPASALLLAIIFSRAAPPSMSTSSTR